MKKKESVMRGGKPAYKSAKKKYRAVADWCRSFRDNDINGVTDLALERKILMSVLPGIYEHWKSTEDGPKFYAVLGAHLDCTTPGQMHAPAVRYYALYGTRAGRATARDLAHPQNGFLVPIFEREYAGRVYTGPRFKLVKSLPSWAVVLLAARFTKTSMLRQHDTRQDYIDSIRGVSLLEEPAFDFSPHELF